MLRVHGKPAGDGTLAGSKLMKFTRNLSQLAFGRNGNECHRGCDQIISRLTFSNDNLLDYDPVARRVFYPRPYHQMVTQLGRGVEHHLNLVDHEQESAFMIVLYIGEPFRDIFGTRSLQVFQVVRMIYDSHAVGVLVVYLALEMKLGRSDGLLPGNAVLVGQSSDPLVV